jgi:hypothetical protein
MRVYVPNKEEEIISEVLKDLYLLKKAIDYNTGTVDSRLAVVDRVRDRLKLLLKEEGDSDNEQI